MKDLDMSVWKVWWVSGGVGLNVPIKNKHIIGHFWDESFQSITCTGTDNLTKNNQATEHTINKSNKPKKVPS